MYAITLHYQRPLAEVDDSLHDHRLWLAENYAAGNFLLSGPQRPRVGGFILAASMDRAELDAILQKDPFCQNSIAAYHVVEFNPATSRGDLSFLVEAP